MTALHPELHHTLGRLRGGLIVSCQAARGEPLHGPEHITALALAAVAGGAVGVRIEGPNDVRAVAAAIDPAVPIIGLWKIGRSGVYITPTLESARDIAAAGGSIVAIDGTGRARPDGRTLVQTIAALHQDGILVMADVSTTTEGVDAATAGADVISTTLSGYTENSPRREGPDLELVGNLVSQIEVPLIAEGRYAHPEQARQALDVGAFAVVVGGAITRPQQITAKFVAALGRQS